MSQRIHLDATPGLFHQVLHCHQGDVGRQFEIAVVTRDGYEIPSGATFKIQATKPSGLGFTVTGTAANNIISFTSTEDMTSEAGEIPTQLEIKSGNDVIYTSNFLLVCEKNTHPASITDGSPEEIISEITLLVERAESAASTAGADAAAAAQARVDEMMDYLPSEVADLKSEITDVTNSIADVSYPEVPREPEVSGYYINSSGELVSASSNYWVTPLVDISAYSKLYITGRANYAHLIYAFYDSSEAFIEGEPSYGGESSTQITDQAVSVPQNAKYVRVALSYNIEPFIGIKYRSISVKGVGELQDFLDDVASTETYQTDTIEAITWESGYVNKGGSSGSGNYVHTNKIPVNKGDRIYLVFAVSGSLGDFRFVTAYDVTGNAVFASGAESTSTSGYTVPDGIVSVIISISGTDTSGELYNIHHIKNTTQNVLDSPNKNDILFGKKWCVCGDSFSYGGQSVMPVFSDGKYAGCRKVYPYFIGNRTHINIVDFTANGRTLAYPSDGSFSNSLTNPSADYYYQNIPADVDYITIYLGINDSHHAPGSGGGDGEDNTGEIPIGTVDDATTATFGGAWNVVLSWLITNRPKAHIGIIVSNGVDNINYRNLTIAIAKKYGIAYIDLNGDERTPAMIRPANNDIPASVKTALLNKWAVEVGVNTHPNTDAHEYESLFIENFLRSI